MDFLLILLALLVIILSKLIHSVVWVPLKIQHHFRKQGIKGPGYRLLVGNSFELLRLITEANSKPSSLNHEVLPRLAPFYHVWSKVYGKNFLYWYGTTPRLAVAEPEMIKDVMMDQSGSFDKARLHPSVELLVGQGLVRLTGQKWAFHRRIANQAFKSYFAWVPDIVASTELMLERWEQEGGRREEFEIEVSKDIHLLTADIISRTAFGKSFEDGKRIFDNQERLTALAALASRTGYIPGFRFLPTAKNRERIRLQREVNESIRKLIERNGDKGGNSTNLLSLLMSPHKNQDGKEEMLEMHELVDECKTFYLGGKETSGNFISWAIICLAMHQDWQNLARQEILRVCKNKKAPSAKELTDLKNITLIMTEVLRLYAPIPMLTRVAKKNVKLGGLDIPTGTQLSLAVAAVHHDPGIWGEDADKFNPLRFNETRKHLASSLPFGLGPRICVGMNLALVEAKVALAMIMMRYSFELSPTYVHAPVLYMTLQPQYGAQIIFRKIEKSKVGICF